jgi:hypothetical protein
VRAKKHGIDTLAAISGERKKLFQKAQAFGFTESEFYDLLLFAWNYKWVMNWPGKGPDGRTMTERVFETIGTRPEEALKVIAMIREQSARRKDNPIRQVLLDTEFDHWTLPDKVIANIVSKKTNNKYAHGSSREKLIRNIKAQRRYLARLYPMKEKN